MLVYGIVSIRVLDIQQSRLYFFVVVDWFYGSSAFVVVFHGVDLCCLMMVCGSECRCMVLGNYYAILVA